MNAPDDLDEQPAAAVPVFARMFRTRDVVLHGDLRIVADASALDAPLGADDAIVLELRANVSDTVYAWIELTDAAAQSLITGLEAALARRARYDAHDRAVTAAAAAPRALR